MRHRPRRLPEQENQHAGPLRRDLEQERARPRRALPPAAAAQHVVREQAPGVQGRAEPLAGHLDPGADPAVAIERVLALLHARQVPRRQQHRLRAMGAAW